MKTERWTAVLGFEGYYEVSNQGSVRSLPRIITDRRGRRVRIQGKMLQGKLDSHGYRRVNLCRDSACAEVSIHSLVAKVFIGPRPEGADVRHLDGDKKNNALFNLAYGTRSENMFDCVRHGRNRQSQQAKCVHGHLLEGANVLWRRSGHRQCRACNWARCAVDRGSIPESQLQEASDKRFELIVKWPERYGGKPTVCSLGHPLEAPNLVPAEARRGTAKCLACDRARALIRDRVKRGRPAPEMHVEAERQYQRVIETNGEPMKPGPKA